MSTVKFLSDTFPLIPRDRPLRGSMMGGVRSTSDHVGWRGGAEVLRVPSWKKCVKSAEHSAELC